MTKSHSPPGSISILVIVLVKSFGPHHCLICSGSVNTSHTSSTGAFSNRVKRSSGSAILFSTDMCFVFVMINLSVQCIVPIAQYSVADFHLLCILQQTDD